jgi:hypothetical protein
MPKLLMHLYGIIPGEFGDIELETQAPLKLEELEKELIRRYGSKIPSIYISDNGLLNHQQVISGDMQGKRIDYDTQDISHVGEIWFVVPIAGG